MENKKFYKILRALMIPIIMQNLINAAVNSADVLMLSFVGQAELSAVSLAGQIPFIFTLFVHGLSAGVSSLTAQYWGKNDTHSIGKIFGIALRFSLGISCIFFLATTFAPELLMHCLTNKAHLITIGATYLRILGISFLFMSISQIYLIAIRSTERVLASTIISTSCLLINIGLNAVFIFGLLGAPKLGVLGVALATSIARAIELLLCFLDSRLIGKNLRLRITSLFCEGGILTRDFVYYASPALGNYISWGVGFTMYSVILGHLNEDVVAANAVNAVVRNLSIILGMGVSNAGAILIGKEIGDKRLQQAKEDGSKVCRLALLFGVIGSVIIVLCRPFILHIANLSDTAHGYLNIMLFMNTYYCVGKVMNCATISGIFCAGGDTRFGLICDSITMWCFAVPLGFLAAFVFKWPIMVVYFCISLDEVVKLPVVYRHYKQYKWVNNITRSFD